MDVHQFLGLEATDDPTRWRLPVTEDVCTPLGFLYGGAGLAAAVAAMEEATARPVLWATAQFLTSAYSGDTLDLDVGLGPEGGQIAQARTVGTVDGVEVLVATGAFGDRPSEAFGRWLDPPTAAPPEDCPPRELSQPMTPKGIAVRLDMRIAEGRQPSELDGTPGSGRSLLWIRAPGLDVREGAALALLADYVPFGIGQALGQRAGGTSLDTTIRVVRTRPSEWLLLDVRIAAVDRGVAHGHLDMWSQDGTLLATASQSAVVRFWR